MAGPGWYKGDLAGWLGKRNVFGKRTAAAQLRVEYDGGITWAETKYESVYGLIALR
jgi:hypothetical protein